MANQRDGRDIEATVREKLSTWRALLTRQTPDGRELLRQVLQGPLRFAPEAKMYRFFGRRRSGDCWPVSFQLIWRPQRDSNPRSLP